MGKQSKSVEKKHSLTVGSSTESKKKEQALRSSKMRYKAIVETCLDGIYQVDRSGKFVFVNEAFAKIFGYKREELLGKHFSDLLTSEVTPGIEKKVEEVLSSKNVQDETIVKHREGYEVPVIYSATPSVVNGKIIGLTGILRDITESKKSEEAIRRSEEYFRAITENSQDAIVILDGDGTIRYESPSTERLWGYEVKDWIGKNSLEFVHPDDLPKMTETLAKLLQHSGSIIYAEARVRHKDGSWHEVESVTQNLLDNQAVQGIVLNLRDITEQKRDQNARREAEEWCSALVENTRDAVVVVQDGIIKFANRSQAELMGYPVEELIGQHYLDVVTPEYKEAIALRYKGRLDGTIPPSNIELKIRRKDGQTRYIEASGTIVGYQGKPADMGITRDITERRQAEEALAQSEEWHRALVETAGEGGQAIIVLQNTPEREAGIVFANRTVSEVLGYSPAEILSLSAWDIIEPSELIVIQERYRLRQRGEKIPSYYEITLLRKDGTAIPVEASTSTMTYRGKVATVVYAKDVTERRRAEELLRSSQEQLRRLSAHLETVREEGRTRIARAIHDELGQALAALKMDLFWLHGKLGEEQQPLLKKTEAMLRITDMLTERVRSISAELRPGLLDDLGLVPALEWQVNEFQNRAGIKCQVSLDSDGIVIDGERATTFFRVLQEALTNVALHSNARIVKVSLRKKGGRMVLTVKDNGQGITQEQINDPKSFGLIGMRERAHFWGGEFKIDAVPGKGTKVIFGIPFSQEEEPK